LGAVGTIIAFLLSVPGLSAKIDTFFGALTVSRLEKIFEYSAMAVVTWTVLRISLKDLFKLGKGTKLRMTEGFGLSKKKSD
jgi:hypothetical protein